MTSDARMSGDDPRETQICEDLLRDARPNTYPLKLAEFTGRILHCDWFTASQMEEVVQILAILPLRYRVALYLRYGLLDGVEYNADEASAKLDNAINVAQIAFATKWGYERLQQILQERWGERRRLAEEEARERAEPVHLGSRIEMLNLSVSPYNRLKKAGIQTVRDLIGRKENDLLAIRNFGRRHLNEVKAKLAEHGFRLQGALFASHPENVMLRVKEKSNV